MAVAPVYDVLDASETPDNLELIRSIITPLRHNVEEARSVSTLFDGDLLMAKSATKSRFLELASEYQILHLATHAKANEKHGTYSFIAFTSQDSLDSYLYANELYGLNLNAQMVVLSACETGIGELRKGEGVYGLTNSCFYSGAQSVVTSLWNVNDRATSTLFNSFYTSLKDGQRKDVAMQKAKTEYLDKTKYPDPFFWAAFVPMGNMAPISTDDSGTNRIWLVVGLLLLLLLVGLWRKSQKT